MQTSGDLFPVNTDLIHQLFGIFHRVESGERLTTCCYLPHLIDHHQLDRARSYVYSGKTYYHLLCPRLAQLLDKRFNTCLQLSDILHTVIGLYTQTGDIFRLQLFFNRN
ncbi:hypothetical protein SAMN05660330_02698 [Desulforhopalus singaporensis]|uniref:Uncharacterized protein n=1 Tax=Desulforhopalus singaporensis TaxID=91360 RepID=A0A1H0SJ34_9BACT|nr:hypothetical protein SAMN05660330_02698 [Desulforhopalus singaporensis]